MCMRSCCLSSRSLARMRLRIVMINLTGASPFFMQQAECAALFTDGVEKKARGQFVLKSPFRENFVASLFGYIYPDAPFSAAETIASALRRHAEWYLEIRDYDRIRSRFVAEMIKPLEPAALKCVLDGSLSWWEGF